MALATDDEGVSRINLTHEYVRAAQTYDLHYADFKRWCETAWNTAFFRAKAFGVRLRISDEPFPRAR